MSLGERLAIADNLDRVHARKALQRVGIVGESTTGLPSAPPEVAELLAKFKGCLDVGYWPAFGGGYAPTSLPLWARRSQELEVQYAND